MKQDVKMPRWLLTFLRWICPDDLIETIEGDVVEQFEYDVQRVGHPRARLRAIIHTLDFVRIGIISRRNKKRSIGPMVGHFFKFSLRGMKKHPGYSFINIAGLSVALATVLLILVYVNDERSYDKFHPDADKIFRIVSTIDMGGQVMYTSFSPNALSDAVAHDYPQVEFISRASFFGTDKIVATDTKEVFAVGLAADAAFFKIFPYKFIEGDAGKPFPDNASVVITKSLALKLFGEATNNVGKVFRNGLHVSAVIDDVPDNSHLRFDYVARMMDYGKDAAVWINFGSYHYVKFKDPSDVDEMSRSINQVLLSKLSSDPRTSGFKGELVFQPLTEIHLGETTYTMEPEGKGNKQYVVIFTLLAIFILAIACINFTNLTTVRGIRRAKEIGLRKTIGAYRLQLVAQLLGESLMAVCIAMLFAIVISALALEPFNAMVGKNLSFNIQTFGTPLLISLGAMAASGLLSGIYPAVILSSVHPSMLMKGAHGTSLGGGTLSRSLVVLQFVFSILIISGTLVVYSQLRYIRTKNLGYQRENVIRVHDWSKTYPTFKSELLQVPGIQAICALDQNLIDVIGGGGIDWPGRTTNGVPIVNGLTVDCDFLKTMKITLMKGRDFYSDAELDTAAVIVNEEAVKLLGVADPLGLKIRGITKGRLEVVGIVKDFHFRSIHESVTPLFINQRNIGNFYTNMLIRIEGDPQRNIDAIEKAWKKFNPQKSFVYSFLDDDLQAMYHSEEITEVLFKVFAAIGIVTACLGLFGLSSYTAEMKSKEYSIRKIFGASSSNLFYSSTIGHLVLVLIATTIAMPVGYYLADRWLSSFAYHASLSVWPFALGGMMATALALITVGSQAMKVIVTRPSVTLRSE
ncbi:ABC transporter permease [Chryseolinea sp. T2]|uniref:ABC transporter permease n=1 Tax=Chryseolinea sp. T2 TaxID=3129255 RepID=UPI003076977F